jgi:hypothetical protein
MFRTSTALAVPLAALLALTACDNSAKDNAPAPAQPKVEVRGPEQNRLHQLSELDRAIGLKRAIYASGSTCKRVTQSRFIGQYKNMDMWGARCDDGRDWALFVGPDSSVQVRLCKDTEKVGLPACGFDGASAKAAPKA